MASTRDAVEAWRDMQFADLFEQTWIRTSEQGKREFSAWWIQREFSLCRERIRKELRDE